MQVKNYELVNEEKVERALRGAPNNNGIFVGGIEKPDGSFDEDELLAKYDSFLGLIKKGNDKLDHGCFFDFKAKKARTEPKVVFVYRINGKVVKVDEGVELPGIVKAARIMEEDAQEVEEKPKKIKKAKRV